MWQPTVDDQLQTIDAILANLPPQAISQAVPQDSQTLNPVTYSPGVKERVEPVADQTALDSLPGVQLVEQEPNPEIPVEVEAYLERAERVDHLPQEIVIAGDQVNTTPIQHLAKQPVIVLPITADEESSGAKKKTNFSWRWLVEWSRKIMKMFTGKVIYRMN